MSSRRTRRELETVRVMIGLFCAGHHRPGGGDGDRGGCDEADRTSGDLSEAGPELCRDCSELWQYARQRVERCPLGRDKPTCLNCAVHCYQRAMQDRIREVMRYAGPRMPARHPILTLFHFLDGRRPTPQRGRAQGGRD